MTRKLCECVPRNSANFFSGWFSDQNDLGRSLRGRGAAVEESTSPHKATHSEARDHHLIGEPITILELLAAATN